jgi:uncharacterized protein
MEARILQLIAALRAGGVRVSLAESAEAFSAVDLMGIQDREQFRLSLRATLVKDQKDLPTFDKLFPLFFRSGQPPMMGGNPSDDMTPEEAQKLAEALRQFAQNLRQRMERLMNGEQLSRSELEALGQMVGLNQADDLRYQKWMAQRMLRALAFPEVREALKELMEQLQQMGMSRDRVEQMRQMIQQNMEGMREQIEQFAGERIAENMSEKPRGESADNLLNRPFHALSRCRQKGVATRGKTARRDAPHAHCPAAEARQKRTTRPEGDHPHQSQISRRADGDQAQGPRAQTEDRGHLRHQHLDAVSARS